VATQIVQVPETDALPGFTPRVSDALLHMYTRYRQDRDLINARDPARLCVLRWCQETNQPVPSRLTRDALRKELTQ
jgi:hypothetical protein